MPFVSSINRGQSSSSAASSPSVPKRREFPSRPRLKIPLPAVAHQFHLPTALHQHHRHQARGPYASPVGLPYGQPVPSAVPLTPTSHTSIPTIVYPSDKPHDGFVLTQLKDLKDWTKSGLSIGEKCVLWLYGKVSSWSKRWFTHIFLCLILLAYTVVGAFLFISIEGNVNYVQQDIRKERDDMIQKIRDLWNDQELSHDMDKWKISARNHLLLYEEKLRKVNYQTDEFNWAFWNAAIYCSTIYTTIVDALYGMENDQQVERLAEISSRLISRAQKHQYIHQSSWSLSRR